MLSIKYTRVSASLGILFTCFLISFSIQSQNIKREDGFGSEKTSSPQQTLQQLVHSFLKRELNPNAQDSVKIIVRDIDSRIDIPKCAKAFMFTRSELSKQQSNMSVKVECPTSSWYLFTHANITTIEKVVVLVDNVSPGTLLTNSNTKLIEVDKNKLRGTAFFAKNDVVGARIKRRVRAGTIIDDRMLCFVCKGDRVTIAAVSDGLSLTVYGVAEEDGVLGDTIQVRNISSDKLVFARIASTTEVQIRI